MIDLFGQAQLEQLLGQQQQWCVSVYLPTHRRAGETPQDVILWKNLLREAEGQLVARHMRPQDAREMLQVARDLANDQHFWVHCEDGLAAFLSPEGHWWFRLPESFDPLVVVNRHFYLVPLIPLVTQRVQFYLLALAQNHVKFYRGDRLGLEEVSVERLPANMDEALQWDTPDATLQAHTGQPGPKSKKTAVFHGQGGLPDAEKRSLADFCHAVHRAVERFLADKREPLLVVAVGELFALYQEINTYAHLVPEPISGNPAKMSLHELHRACLEKLQRLIQDRHREVVEDLAAKLASPLVSLQVEEVLPAAMDGRVDTLLVAQGKHIWGSYDPQARRVNLAEAPGPECEDLLDLAARETYLRRGQVLVVSPDQLAPLRNNSNQEVLLAARFRYAVEQTPAAS